MQVYLVWYVDCDYIDRTEYATVKSIFAERTRAVDFILYFVKRSGSHWKAGENDSYTFSTEHASSSIWIEERKVH